MDHATHDRNAALGTRRRRAVGIVPVPVVDDRHDAGGAAFRACGPHVWILLGLASVEILAAIMFLAPVVNVAGSYLLLAVFACAILIHVLQGQFDVGFLLVYAMAVTVWLAHRREEREGVRVER